jgi:hypothetical protein
MACWKVMSPTFGMVWSGLADKDLRGVPCLSKTSWSAML